MTKNVEASRDAQKIQFNMSNACELVSLERAKQYLADLTEAIKEVESRDVPPAPPAIYIDQNHEIIEYEHEWGTIPEEFTCMAMVGNPPDQVAEFGFGICILGFEMEMAEVVVLHDWIEKLMKYYGVKK